MSHPGQRLRDARRAAHAAFDPLWRYGDMTRSEAYRWLSEKVGTPPEKTHIGMFNRQTCEFVVRLCEARAHHLTAQQFDTYA